MCVLGVGGWGVGGVLHSEESPCFMRGNTLWGTPVTELLILIHCSSVNVFDKLLTAQEGYRIFSELSCLFS